MSRTLLGMDPNDVNPQWLKANPFSATILSHNIEGFLPFIVIVNNDTVDHTVTLNSREQSDKSSAITQPVPQKSWVPLPTLPFASLQLDGGGTPGSVFYYYSDVSPGPRFAGGAGPAATVYAQLNDAYTPSSTGTFLMEGKGGNFSITPNKSGKVVFSVRATMLNTAQGELSLVRAYFGTGTPPLTNAAVTGTLIGGGSTQFASGSTAGINSKIGASFSAYASGLTVGTAYWFDCAVNIAGATDAFILIDGFLVELAN